MNTGVMENMKPIFSNGDYKRLSKRLREAALSNEIGREDYEMLQTLRIVNDYISKPKKSGYRSIHLEVHLATVPDKVIEIQIRRSRTAQLGYFSRNLRCHL